MSGSENAIAPLCANNMSIGNPVGTCLFFLGNEEPKLTDVLADPIIHKLMNGDGIQMATLLLLISNIQINLRKSELA